MIKRPCNRPGCPALVRKGYCADHQPSRRRPRDDKKRFYNSARWQRVRRLYRRRHPLCERCEAEGHTTVGELVHHRTPLREGGARFDFDNLETLCRSHHAEEHAG